MLTTSAIPFNVPFVPDLCKKYVLEVLDSKHQQGDGPFTKKASREISKLVGGGEVLLTPSCTHALELASMLLNLGPSDEVILPSYTFTSAATAVAKFGATPVFVDIESNTAGVSVESVRSAITTKTKAISWVNYAGVAPDIEGLQQLASEFGLYLIEDNAHGLGGTYKGKQLGSFGDFATQSFHATKNIQCGEGGALVVNNSKFFERAEIIREKGTDRSKFVKGQIQKYQWVDQGSSYLLAESLAAVLLGQLENFDDIQKARLYLWDQYFSFFKEFENSHFEILPQILTNDTNVAHMFYLNLGNESIRERVRLKLLEYGVTATSHYVPLETSPFGAQISRTSSKAENSHRFSQTILRFPLYVNLEIERVFSVLYQLDRKLYS